MTSYLGDGMFDVGDDDDIIIQCECGRVWAMDYEPTPYGCEGSVWRLRCGDDWGVWIDQDGNQVAVSEVREQESSGDS